ncbi:hypothetical protein ACTID9_21160 [Brevibacillus fluminis]|uniref:hypothetical protein n=1 Tax=Brevibacillus fluminis TaxID=511487 RepID=UPI003F8BC858
MEWMLWGLFLFIAIAVVIGIASGKNRSGTRGGHSYTSSDSSGFVSDGGSSFWDSNSNDCGSSGSDGGSCGSDGGGGGGD